MLRKKRKWNYTKCLIKIKATKRENERQNRIRTERYKIVTNMVDSNPTTSITTLNMNGLNVLIERKSYTNVTKTAAINNNKKKKRPSYILFWKK